MTEESRNQVKEKEVRKKEKIKQLRATQELLQAGHDYLETHGFDIERYTPRPGTGECCYIGVVRMKAGVRPGPGYNAGEGDGPQLRAALEELDAVAKKRLRPSRIHSIADEYGFLDGDVGRYVEKLGFIKDEKGVSREGQRRFALKVFREALTNVHNELEALVS